MTHFESSSQQEGWGFFLIKISGRRKIKREERGNLAWEGVLTLGKNISLKGSNSLFFPPLVSKKHPRPCPTCTPPRGVCSFVFCLQLAKIQVSCPLLFHSDPEMLLGGVRSICWGSGFKQHFNFTPRTKCSYNFSILPSTGRAERWKRGYFFFSLYPLFFTLFILGVEGKEKGWIHPKTAVLFSVRETQNFLLSSTSKASVEP